MGYVAEYEIACEQLPLVAVASEVPGATIEVEIGPKQGGHPPFIVSVADESTAAIERAFESATFVADYVSTGLTDGTRRYKIRPAVGMAEQLGDHVDDLDELRGLNATESIIDRIRVTPDGWIQTGWFAELDTLNEFRRFWQANAGFTLRRLTHEEEVETPAEGLTDRQQEAVRTAYEMGYFEIPRTASLEDVASELGITAPSLSERLRRAHAHLAETAVLPTAGGVRSRTEATPATDT
ncbi:helix-turn-helix domain-containing protein [Halopiger goleimassiliensis]|uniref:helix-turn-helix domain-containing protein n=1 Tax=Halopiger goleimassiliensis TaxID=1293048 RepID=UPI000677F479|nr:helix-turn-helix domain-containing protein [Halopiger goleimassiliensis]